MKCGIGVALALACVVAAAPWLSAQAPDKSGTSGGGQSQPAAGGQSPAQQPTQAKPPTNANPFPEDTDSVPVMPTRISPDLASGATPSPAPSRAGSAWHRVLTTAPRNSSNSNSWGTAVISFDFWSTAICPSDSVLAAGPGADQVQGRAAGSRVVTAPQRLGVDGHGLAVQRIADGGQPGLHAQKELGRVEPGEYPAESVVRRDALRQVEKLGKPVTSHAGKTFDVGVTVATGQRRAQMAIAIRDSNGCKLLGGAGIVQRLENGKTFNQLCNARHRPSVKQRDSPRPLRGRLDSFMFERKDSKPERPRTCDCPGASIHSGDREFGVPEHYPLRAAGTRVDSRGNKFIRVKGVRWFTNLDYPERHEDLLLFKTYSKAEYPKFDHYDAINVNKTKDIPVDYRGAIGVPLKFLDKFNPEQFEIIDGLNRYSILEGPTDKTRGKYLAQG